MAEPASMTERRFAAAEGRRFMARALAKVGLPPGDADAVAEMMLFADLRGVDSHGIVRLPSYVARLKAGGVNPTPDIRVVNDAPGDGAGRWRQRHGPSRHAPRRAPRHRQGPAGGRCLGRHAAQQPCRRRRLLCHDGAAARHDRALSRGREQQPHGAHGRDRGAARHQSDRRRHPDPGRAADRARHRHHRHLGRQAPPRRRQ